jgi:hypothetical protein
MAASETALSRSSWLQDFNSMMVSASCHFLILICLGLIAVGTQSGHSDQLVMTLGDGGGLAPGEGHELGMPDGEQLDDPSKLETVSTAEAVAAIGPANPVEDPLASNLENRFDVPNTIPVSLNDVSGGGGSKINGAVGDGAADALKFGIMDGTSRGGGGKGDGTSYKATDFFGIGGYGKTFIYVVDASDSMNENGKFQRCRYELLKSIEQLTSHQRFFVIFYNTNAYPMEAEGPLEASPENKSNISNWIRSVEPEGGTNPLPALVLALSMRPDAIYFLSDGQFDPNVIMEMKQRNRQNYKLELKMVPIHTVAFFDRLAEGLMKMIARNSNGEYRFVH